MASSTTKSRSAIVFRYGNRDAQLRRGRMIVGPAAGAARRAAVSAAGPRPSVTVMPQGPVLPSPPARQGHVPGTPASRRLSRTERQAWAVLLRDRRVRPQTAHRCGGGRERRHDDHRHIPPGRVAPHLMRGWAVRIPPTLAAVLCIRTNRFGRNNTRSCGSWRVQWRRLFAFRVGAERRAH
jgi:hypothetical protein